MSMNVGQVRFGSLCTMSIRFVTNLESQGRMFQKSRTLQYHAVVFVCRLIGQLVYLVTFWL
jgi:hypothetical protein